MNNTENETFEYTYSSKEREEIKKIRDKYIPKEESALEKLRKLDSSASRKASIFSIIVGVISSLIFGAGMSLCLVWGDDLLVEGIIIGILGISGIALAYPVYSHTLKKEREKIAPEILKISEELLK